MGERSPLARQWYDWLQGREKFSTPLYHCVRNLNTYNEALWALAEELALAAPSGPPK